jgi:beta-glucosidase/6-phospho-beta-glucosidase/beta-galactosidase
MLLQFDERYKKYNMPFIITENGVSDATDIIRRPYIIEHLLAVRAAMDKVH